VFDPCCGSGGMFVQSEKFVEQHGGRVGDIAVYGQESNYTTWKLARMNLAIRDFSLSASNGERVGVRCRIPRNADSFRQVLHPDLKADFILANPPFNMSDWGGENLRQDMRWKFGMPAANNANYAWIQHFIHPLSPVGGAGFVMAKTTRSAHPCSMKITEDVGKYSAEQGIAEEEALKKGMEAKSKEFVEKGAEVMRRCEA